MKKMSFLIIALMLVFGFVLIPVSPASSSVDFSIIIVKYHDKNINGEEDSEPRLPGWVFTVIGPEDFYKSVTTGGDGTVTVEDLGPGTYTITEALKGGWINTDPVGGSLQKTVTLSVEQPSATVKFGNYWQGGDGGDGGDNGTVGGQVGSVNKFGVLTPWLGLALVVIGGTSWLILRLRRRRA